MPSQRESRTIFSFYVNKDVPRARLDEAISQDMLLNKIRVYVRTEVILRKTFIKCLYKFD